MWKWLGRYASDCQPSAESLLSVAVLPVAPCRWSLTCLPLRYLCCSAEADLWDWITSFLRAQVRLLSDQR